MEEVYVAADEFANAINQTPKLVLAYELPVLQTLNFDLIVYGPFRCLAAFYQHYREWKGGGGGGEEVEVRRCFRVYLRILKILFRFTRNMPLKP